MADIDTGTDAAQAAATDTERIASETPPASAGGQEHGSNSQTQQATNSTDNNQQQNTTQADKDKAETEKRVREANKEAANYRVQLKEANEQREATSKTLAEITSERDTLRNEIRELKVTREVEAIVNASQPHSLNDVMRLIDMGSIKVDGRTGQVDTDAIVAKVQQLQRESAYLFKGSGRLGADAGAIGNTPASVGMNDMIRNAIQHRSA